MKLGIVGLPNVGKSTLFNSLTKAGAESANYPFCTIDPNVGIVPVPDERLDVLGKLYDSEKVVPDVSFCHKDYAEDTCDSCNRTDNIDITRQEGINYIRSYDSCYQEPVVEGKYLIIHLDCLNVPLSFWPGILLRAQLYLPLMRQQYGERCRNA